MKRYIALILAVVLAVSLAGCASEAREVEVVDTITTEFSTYYKMSDGTWQMDGRSYQYRLELTGRMPSAALDTTFVYLSNLESITYEQAWKAAGLSSDLHDYFSPEEAVLVEMKTK